MPIDETRDPPVTQTVSQSADPRRLDELLDDFDLNWAPTRLDEVARNLPAGVGRREALIELVQIDLERCWRNGERPQVEDYLARFPDLGPADDPPTELLRAELEAREWYGDTLGPTALQMRFPRAANRITTITINPARRGRGSERPEPIPGYEFLGELGRGGMGVVQKARHVKLDREVALKTLARGDADPGRVARFWAEGQVMAAVKHPHVVQVFELGEHAGRPFMAMELVAGGNLAEWLSGHAPVPPRAAAAIVEKIARGVAAAHDLGIVHRDLKPGNILLAGDGSPKVADFGLAKRQSADLTHTHALMGTPAYMAPEQAAGRAKFVGPQADVWAIGVILYECVTGKRPFVGDSLEELLSQITSAEPVALRTRVRGVPRDVATVVSKCLAKEPEHRYATAGELADDLGRFVRGESIAARPVGTPERLLRWARRKPTAAAAYAVSAVAFALAVVVLVVAGLWQTAVAAKTDAETAQGQAEAAKTEAETAKTEAETARDALDGQKKKTEAALGEAIHERGKAVSALEGEKAAKANVERLQEVLVRSDYARTVNLAHRHCRENNPAQAMELLGSCRADLRGWEWHHVRRLCSSELLTYTEYRGPVVSAAFSPDGTRVLTVGDGTVHVWDAVTGRRERLLALGGRFGIKGVVTSAAYSPDGTRIVTALSNGEVVFWDSQPARSFDADRPLSLVLRGHTGPILTVAYSQNGTRIVTASTDGTARIWDVHTGTTLRELVPVSQPMAPPVIPCFMAAFSPDGTRVATANGDRAVRIWDAETGNILRRLPGYEAPYRWVAFSHDGARLVTAGASSMALVWDVKTGTQLFPFRKHTMTVRCVAYHPDGKQVVTCGEDNTTRVWDAEDGTELYCFSGHTAPVLSAAFSPDGTRLVTGSQDRTARVWDTQASRESLVVNSREAQTRKRVSSAAFSPDGTRVLATTVSFPARIRRIDGGKEVMSFQHPEGRTPYLAAYSPEGTRVVTAAAQSVLVWDAVTGAKVCALRGHTSTSSAIAFSPDGTRVLTTSAINTDKDYTARIWDADSGQLLRTLEHSNGLKSAEFSPDGGRVVTACRDKVARVWDARTGKVLLTLGGRSSWLLSARFSPGGQQIVTISEEASKITHQVWDAVTGRELHVFQGHLPVSGTDVAAPGTCYSPDCSVLLTRGYDATPRLWDARTGRELCTLRGHNGFVFSAAFSPDGSRIVTGGSDRTARLWDAATGYELLTFAGYENTVRGTVFSLDGTCILAVEGQNIRIWDARSVNRALLPPAVAPRPRER